MTQGNGELAHLLRNTPVREIVRALERDGFILERQTRTGGRIYRHPDTRKTVIHYHRGSQTFIRKTLRSILRATKWTREDMERLGLL
ncbi:MAG: type II toxin-antitoxin system HicA family toxin [Chloroflexi bacterium]|nr:type II toxin-antitoxin system HicA family toxin [Chloroflexota bacterium]